MRAFFILFSVFPSCKPAKKGTRTRRKGKCRMKSTRQKAGLPFPCAAPLGSALLRINNGFPWPEDSTKASNTAGHSDQHPFPLKPGICLVQTLPRASLAFRSSQRSNCLIAHSTPSASEELEPPCFVQQRGVFDHAPAPSICSPFRVNWRVSLLSRCLDDTESRRDPRSG